MLPSSYTRRLRTNDLIKKTFPDVLTRSGTKASSKTFTRVDFNTGPRSRLTHAYLPNLLREKTRTHHSSRVSGQINLVLKKLSEDDEKKQEEEIYQQKLQAVFFKENRDTPIPPKIEKQPSRMSLSKQPRLQAIKEKKEKPSIVKQKPVDKNKKKVAELMQLTIEHLTREKMIEHLGLLMKDKRMSKFYRRNFNRIEILTPIVCEGIPPWSKDFGKEVIIIVPIKSLRYTKWKYSINDIGYLQIELPKQPPKNRKDIYEPLRADDGVHLSSSKLNKALVEIFVEGIKNAKFGEYAMMPDVNFDYLNDTLELVYSKQYRVPLVPAIYLSPDDPVYSIRPNIPDLDPTSDILFRACFLQEEERIMDKIASTDNGLRFDALKVIHTLCKQDWRLQMITVYQLKNVLMHDIDFEIDHSPRWQRLTRDICVQSVLKRLLYFVKKRKLPHFFQSEFNLFKGISDKYLTLMQTPLERLVSNEPQLLRDLQRASRSYEESSSSSESDEDWW